jgi:hypothetical protein
LEKRKVRRTKYVLQRRACVRVFNIGLTIVTLYCDKRGVDFCSITFSTGDETKMKFNRIATTVLGMQMLVGLAAVPALAAGKSQTLTGEVSDAMCGAKHEMPGKPADCTRGCMKHGSKYALVVGDKVYTLETSDKAALDKLNDLAGEKAKVTGEVDGTTVTVKSVAAGS